MKISIRSSHLVIQLFNKITILLILLPMVTFADIIRCPTIDNGTYPNQFQVAGDQSTVWTLQIKNQSFITVNAGVQWNKLSTTTSNNILYLQCSGFTKDENKAVSVQYPIFHSTLWSCQIDNANQAFNCNITQALSMKFKQFPSYH